MNKQTKAMRKSKKPVSVKVIKRKKLVAVYKKKLQKAARKKNRK